MTGRDLIIYLSFKYKQNWQDIYHAVKNREGLPQDLSYSDAEKEVLSVSKNLKGKAITILDPEYPEMLKSSTKTPPFVILLNEDDRILFDDTTSKDICEYFSFENESLELYNEMLKQATDMGMEEEFVFSYQLLISIGFNKAEACRSAMHVCQIYQARGTKPAQPGTPPC